MTRQTIIDSEEDTPPEQEHTPRRWALIDESALHRVVGSTEIKHAQRAHLAAMAQRPNITIQIIPNSEGVTCAYGRAFSILTVNSGSAVVYLEDIIKAGYVRGRDQVAQFTLRFDHLRASSLDDKRSLKRVK